MKKLIIAISLVIILIFSAVGTAVMAAPPPPENIPVVSWDEILDGVEELLTKIGSVTTWGTIADGIEAIYGELTDVQEGMEAISENLTRMKSGSGEIALPGSGVSNTVFGDIEGPIQHVSLSIARCCGGGWESGEQIRIQANWPETESETRIVKTYELGGDTLDYVDTLEFNASQWAIITNNTRPAPFDGWRIHYAYTSTYVSD